MESAAPAAPYSSLTRGLITLLQMTTIKIWISNIINYLSLAIIDNVGAMHAARLTEAVSKAIRDIFVITHFPSLSPNPSSRRNIMQ